MWEAHESLPLSFFYYKLRRYDYLFQAGETKWDP